MKDLLTLLFVVCTIPAFLHKADEVVYGHEVILPNKFEIIELYEEEIKDDPITQEVNFTSYYVGDECESYDMTGSGLNSSNFNINENGWYTYNGKVVIATATYECMNNTYGVCGNYNSLPDGYSIFSYFDEVVIAVNGVEYEAIVLDSCGASFWDEDYQRFDIYVSSKDYSVGKVRGTVMY